MLASFIVPIYHGQKYIPNIISMVEKNKIALIHEGIEEAIELIFINDSPEIQIRIDSVLLEKVQFDIHIYENQKNVGIHQSRVNGYTFSKGKYLVFLDQDDLIADNYLVSQMKYIQSSDMVVANGYKEINDRKKVIYKSKAKQALVLQEKVYLKAANQITSPGQCLIKKDAIPTEWLTNIVKANGGDDILLWFLLFAKKAKIELNEDCIYTHVDTGNNTSNDLSQMLSSSADIIQIMKKCSILSQKTIRGYEKRIVFLNALNSKNKVYKVFVLLRNIDICLYKLYAYYR